MRPGTIRIKSHRIRQLRIRFHDVNFEYRKSVHRKCVMVSLLPKNLKVRLSGRHLLKILKCFIDRTLCRAFLIMHDVSYNF